MSRLQDDSCLPLGVPLRLLRCHVRPPLAPFAPRAICVCRCATRRPSRCTAPSSRTRSTPTWTQRRRWAASSTPRKPSWRTRQKRLATQQGRSISERSQQAVAAGNRRCGCGLPSGVLRLLLRPSPTCAPRPPPPPAPAVSLWRPAQLPRGLPHPAQRPVADQRLHGRKRYRCARSRGRAPDGCCMRCWRAGGSNVCGAGSCLHFSPTVRPRSSSHCLQCWPRAARCSAHCPRRCPPLTSGLTTRQASTSTRRSRWVGGWGGAARGVARRAAAAACASALQTRFVLRTAMPRPARPYPAHSSIHRCRAGPCQPQAAAARQRDRRQRGVRHRVWALLLPHHPVHLPGVPGRHAGGWWGRVLAWLGRG